MSSILLVGAGSSSSGGDESSPLAITSNGGGPTASIDYNEGITTAITTVVATGGVTPRVFSITGGADAAFFDIDPSTGVLIPLAAFDYEDPDDDGTNNSYVVEVTVTDDVAATDSQTITANVQNVEEPTIFTLTISDLENFVNGANSQLLRFDVDPAGNPATTSALNLWNGPGELKDSGSLAMDLVAVFSGALGGAIIAVDNQSTGGDYIFELAIPEVSEVTSLTLNTGASQLFPVITLTEAVVQDGINGVQEQVSITADDLLLGMGDTTSDNNGNSVTVDASNVYSGSAAGSGWTAGAPSGNTVVFTKDVAGEAVTSKASGNGTVVVTTAGAGRVEIHTITPTPIPPTGGEYKPGGAGSSVLYNADAAAIAAAVSTSFGSTGCTADQPLSSGVVALGTLAFENVSDVALAPVNVSLTAPAISVGIA